MATLNPEMSIADSNYGGGLTDVLSEVNPNDAKKNVNINTQETDEIDEAIKMLSVFIDELGPAYFPWVEQTSKILMNLIAFEANVGIRQSVASSLPGIITCIYEA